MLCPWFPNTVFPMNPSLCENWHVWNGQVMLVVLMTRSLGVHIFNLKWSSKAVNPLQFKRAIRLWSVIFSWSLLLFVKFSLTSQIATLLQSLDIQFQKGMLLWSCTPVWYKQCDQFKSRSSVFGQNSPVRFNKQAIYRARCEGACTL